MLAKTYSYGGFKYIDGKLFAIKRQPPKQQPFLLVMNWPGDPAAAKVLVDPNELDPTGSTAIDAFAPSHDGKLLAVSLSKGGSESGDVHLFDATTGRARARSFPASWRHGRRDLSWAADDSGFFYPLSPRRRTPGSRPRFLHASLFSQTGNADGHDRYEMARSFRESPRSN